MDIKQALNKIATRQDLTGEEMRGVMTTIMNGEATPSQIGAFLMGMRVKGETEEALTKVGFKRLDILHPGLLRGERVDDLRFAERAAIIAAPLIDPLLSGSWERYRSIDAALVAEAALGLALRRAGGRFTHDNEAMRRAAREWRRTHEAGEVA